jgi:hypothetical protein
MDDLAATVRRLADTQAIADVVGARYAKALDWLDLPRLKQCFWEDGHVDYGFFVGNAHEWCDVVMPIEASSLHRFHYVFNILVDLDGDRATVESNSLAGSRRPGGDADDAPVMQSLHGSRYLDIVERRDDQWRILERTVLLEFTNRSPSPDAPHGAISALQLVSGLGPDDPRYRPYDL